MKHKKNKYVDILKEVNLRPTRQRVVLVSNIFNSGNRHINAEKLHEEVLFLLCKNFFDFLPQIHIFQLYLVKYINMFVILDPQPFKIT